MHIAATTEINQIAYVVPDMDAAVAFWTDTMGVGPFLLLRDIAFDRADYHGVPAAISYSAAIAYSGGLNVELIAPNGPSIFADWLAEGRSGVQHVCRFTHDFAASEADVLSRGGRRLQGGDVAGGTIGYYDMTGDGSVVLELAQLTPAALAMFDAVRVAAETWNGTTRWIDPATAAEALPR